MSERSGLLLLDGELVPGSLWFEAGRITRITRGAALSPGAGKDLLIIAPGLVDLHVHGYAGSEPITDLAGMGSALARVGTTSYLPTLFPEQPAALGATCSKIWSRAQGLALSQGARVLGLHLEGPFVNPLSAGALPIDCLAEPSPAALAAILGSSSGDAHGIRTMTLAAELPGSADLVQELTRAGVRVSLGHSLATSAEARSAAKAGALGVTHLFNAMSKLHHREVGLLGFALSSDALCAEIIGDLVHVGRDAVELSLRARGVQGLALVSDALPGAGTGCDVFECHGATHRIRDGAIWIDDRNAPDGSRLGGAATPQLGALRRLVRAGVVSLPEALRMAAETPARSLGLGDELGCLRVGARADLILLDSALELREVLLGGKIFELGHPGNS